MRKEIVIAILILVLASVGGCSKKEQNEAVYSDYQVTETKDFENIQPEDKRADLKPTQTNKPAAVPEKETQKEVKKEIEVSAAPIEKPAEIKAEETPKPSEKVISTKSPEEEKAEKNENEIACTMSVRCDEILKNMDKLSQEKHKLVPSDGIIFSGSKIAFEEGESAFDVLKREMKNNKIHLEFSMTPGFNTAYVEGINNIYEFDCGDMSGWTYLVNGEMQSVGCSQYLLKDGDVVEWIYICGM